MTYVETQEATAQEAARAAFEQLPPATSCRLIDFETAEVILLSPVSLVLVVEGEKPYANMRVELVPGPPPTEQEWWDVEVVGCLSGIGLPVLTPYSATLEVLGSGGFKGFRVIGATKTAEVPVPAEAQQTKKEAKPALFRFTDINEEPRFVIQLVELEKVEHARRILRGEETLRVHIQGLIVKEPAAYNPGWSYHLAPKSIDFFEVAIEVCDATIDYVEEHLDEVGGSTLPGSHWCPWTSRLVDEVVPEQH